MSRLDLKSWKNFFERSLFDVADNETGCGEPPDACQLVPRCRIIGRQSQRLLPGAHGFFDATAILEGTAQVQVRPGIIRSESERLPVSLHGFVATSGPQEERPQVVVRRRIVGIADDQSLQC